jgi:transposase
LEIVEVQRGQAIALLIQGQRQQQVALQFGVNVFTIERLVRRLRDIGRVADRPRRGRLRVTTPHQDRTIHLADELADQTRAIGFSVFG